MGCTYRYLSPTVVEEWHAAGSCPVTFGTAFSEQARAVVGDMPLLILGVGTQGGDLATTVRLVRDSRGQGMIINASRSILYASDGADYQQAARQAAGALDRGIAAALRER